MEGTPDANWTNLSIQPVLPVTDLQQSSTTSVDAGASSWSAEYDMNVVNQFIVEKDVDGLTSYVLSFCEKLQFNGRRHQYKGLALNVCEVQVIMSVEKDDFAKAQSVINGEIAKLLGPSEDEFFTPLDMKKRVKVLQTCVSSKKQFSDEYKRQRIEALHDYIKLYFPHCFRPVIVEDKSLDQFVAACEDPTKFRCLACGWVIYDGKGVKQIQFHLLHMNCEARKIKKCFGLSLCLLKRMNEFVGIRDELPDYGTFVSRYKNKSGFSSTSIGDTDEMTIHTGRAGTTLKARIAGTGTTGKKAKAVMDSGGKKRKYSTSYGSSAEAFEEPSGDIRSIIKELVAINLDLGRHSALFEDSEENLPLIGSQESLPLINTEQSLPLIDSEESVPLVYDSLCKVTFGLQQATFVRGEINTQSIMTLATSLKQHLNLLCDHVDDLRPSLMKMAITNHKLKKAAMSFTLSAEADHTSSMIGEILKVNIELNSLNNSAVFILESEAEAIAIRHILISQNEAIRKVLDKFQNSVVGSKSVFEFIYSMEEISSRFAPLLKNMSENVKAKLFEVDDLVFNLWMSLYTQNQVVETDKALPKHLLPLHQDVDSEQKDVDSEQKDVDSEQKASDELEVEESTKETSPNQA